MSANDTSQNGVCHNATIVCLVLFMHVCSKGTWVHKIALHLQSHTTYIQHPCTCTHTHTHTHTHTDIQTNAHQFRPSNFWRIEVWLGEHTIPLFKKGYIS